MFIQKLCKKVRIGYGCSLQKADVGAESLGYKKYDLPKLTALILVYPIITMTDLAHRGSKDKLLGIDFRKEDVQAYSIEKQVTECYRETFFWYCEADALVLAENSEMSVE